MPLELLYLCVYMISRITLKCLFLVAELYVQFATNVNRVNKVTIKPKFSSGSRSIKPRDEVESGGRY